MFKIKIAGVVKNVYYVRTHNDLTQFLIHWGDSKGWVWVEASACIPV